MEENDVHACMRARSKELKQDIKKFYKKLYLWNVLVHGYKALVYGFTLGDIRYVEYSTASAFLKPRLNDFILDVGCGHSILPVIFKSRTNVVVIDVNLESLKWQINVSNRVGGKGSLIAVLASAHRLPFKTGIFSGVVSISTIEHLPYEMDIEACSEIGRILRTEGIGLITIPASEQFTTIGTDWRIGIPVLFAKIFRSILPTIFQKLKIGDRSNSYFERYYATQDVYERLLKSSRCRLEKLAVIERRSNGARLIQAVRKLLIPFGFISPFEYFCAKTFVISENSERPMISKAFVLTLEKADTSIFARIHR